jgi:exosortase A
VNVNTSGSIIVAQSTRRDLVSLLSIVVVAGLVASVYAPTFVAMAHQWQYADHRQCVLIFPIAGYLLWRLRADLGTVPLVPSVAGVVALAALVLVWVVAKGAGVEAAEYLAALWMIPAAVAAMLGTAALRRALFPLLFLTLAAPVGDALIPPLMRITADLAAGLLRAVDVPVHREGQFLMLPGGDFEVAEICSGLRYLSAGTTVGLLFAYLTYRSAAKRALFTAATALTVVLANAVRAFVVMFVASLTEMRYMAGYDHVVFGWLLFAGALVGLFVVGVRFADTPGEPARRAGGGHAASFAHFLPLVVVLAALMLAVTAQPYRSDVASVGFWLVPVGVLLLFVLGRAMPFARAGTDGSSSMPARFGVARAAILAAAVATLAAGPALIAAPGVGVGVDGMRSLALPASEACGGAQAWQATWQPVFAAPDFAGRGTYRCAGETVNAFLAGYDTSGPGRELTGTANRLIPDSWRRIGDVRSVELAGVQEQQIITINELEISSVGRQALIWYWYRVGDRTVARPWAVKLLEVWQVVSRRPASTSAYLLETHVDGDEAEGRERLALVARSLAEVSAPPADRGRGLEAVPWPSAR